jgi:predicted dehydrogenase
MKVAVLGLGFMGSTHLRALQTSPLAEVVAVASNEPEVLTGAAPPKQGNLGAAGEALDLHGIRTYDDFNDAILDPDVEAVDICLPTNLHAPAAIAALRAGKHVLVEKPMGLSGEETDRMMAEANKAGRVLMSAQVLRFSPAYQALADAVRGGRLGAVRSAMFRRRCAAPVWSRWLTDPAQSGGGVFDLLIHDVDQCLWLFGWPAAVSATGYSDLSIGVDTMVASLHYPGIASVTVAGGWHHPKAYPFSMEFTVIGDRGTLDYHSSGRAPTLFHADGEASVLQIEERDGYAAEIEYFLECCQGNRTPDRCPPSESAAAVKLMRMLIAARERNGQLVPAPQAS